MSRRICDACSKGKDMHGGRTCENGHFILISFRHVTLRSLPVMISRHLI